MEVFKLHHDGMLLSKFSLQSESKQEFPFTWLYKLKQDIIFNNKINQYILVLFV